MKVPALILTIFMSTAMAAGQVLVAKGDISALEQEKDFSVVLYMNCH